MKIDVVMQMANWLVEHNEAGFAAEAFAGDLQESFANGRSRWWCFAQALQRVTSSSGSRFRVLLLTLGYCIAFALLFPLWQWLYMPSVNRLLTEHRSSAVWPGSAVLEISVGLLPAILFIWTGVFLFLLLRLQSITLMRTLFSLSLGCCVVSGETMLRLGDMVQPDLHVLSRADFTIRHRSPGSARCCSWASSLRLAFSPAEAAKADETDMEDRHAMVVTSCAFCEAWAFWLCLCPKCRRRRCHRRERPQSGWCSSSTYSTSTIGNPSSRRMSQASSTCRLMSSWRESSSVTAREGSTFASSKKIRRHRQLCWCRSTILINLHALASK